MANPALRLPQNVAGEFFVDSTCIDCDTCRQLAPACFRDHGGASSVHRQPAGEGETRRALMALVACPTGSIGIASKGGAYGARPGAEAFPPRSRRTFTSAASPPRRASGRGVT